MTMIIWLHQSIWWYVSRLLNRPREWRYLATKNLVEAEEVPTALQGVDAGYHRQLRDLTIDLCTSGPRSTDGLSIHQESSPYHCDTKFGEVISPFPLIHTLQLIQLFGWMCSALYRETCIWICDYVDFRTSDFLMTTQLLLLGLLLSYLKGWRLWIDHKVV